VEITGHVADIKPFLYRAACLVVPLRYGGGLRIRIIEAMMAGLPVVCSSVAIAGMDFEPGKDYLPADDPKETAEAIKKLVENPQLAAEMAQNARRAVTERYGLEVQSERVLEMFSAILNR
jgi:glycosyltransferase involved in cell wall biosynthesis